MEPDIAFARIDNRLIRPRVATQWNGALVQTSSPALTRSQAIKMRQNLMDMAAPSGVATRYFTLRLSMLSSGLQQASTFLRLVAESEDVLTLVKRRCSNRKK